MSRPTPLAAVSACLAIFALALPLGAEWPVWLFVSLIAVVATTPIARLDLVRGGALLVSACAIVVLLCDAPTTIDRLHEFFPESPRARAVRTVWACTALGIVACLPLRGAWRFASLAAFLGLLGVLVTVWVYRLSLGAPNIDVYQMHVEALARFARGDSPYSGSFLNVYPHTEWYGPGLVVDGRVQIGYAYPPLPFLFALLGDWLGDFRVGFLVAAGGAALALAAIGGVAGRAGAVLLLAYPRHGFVIDQSWTEPVFVLTFALVLLAALRHRPLLPIALGLFWTSKQYAALLLPLVPLLLPVATRRQILGVILLSFVVAAIFYVPFFLWDPRGFVRSVVMYQIWQPFRFDGLGVLVWWVRRGHDPPGNLVTFGALLLGLGASALVAPRGVAGFAAGSALALLLFFAFAKQAFMNYYYGCVGMLAGLVAISLGGRNQERIGPLRGGRASGIKAR